MPLLPDYHDDCSDANSPFAAVASLAASSDKRNAYHMFRPDRTIHQSPCGSYTMLCFSTKAA
jgi:hypothetical protein